MGQIRTLIHSLANGEVSISSLARVDQEKARLWAETQENLLPFTIGKAAMRPGTTYLGASASNAKARGIEFVKALSATAGLELTNAKLRVWVSDALVTRPSVTSTVTNGDFASSAGWTLTASAGATADINSSAAGQLYLACSHKGGTATCTRSVTTTSAGTQHALRIVVVTESIMFRCGSSSGADDYIEETELDRGEHSLAFTPSGTYHVYFSHERAQAARVESIQVEAAGAMEFTAPWTEDELFEIQYDQSGDIVFLTHANWQQRKIERRGNASWSLVYYRSDDGPFTATRTSPVKLSPSGTYEGELTLAADGDIFRAGHVGALFRLTHDRLSARYLLGGAGAFSDAWRVNGIGADNTFNLVVSSSSTAAFTGVLTLQRSYDDRFAGFIDTTATFSATGTLAFAPGTTFDNVIHYYRIGFKTTDYTTGTAIVDVVYSGDSGSGVCRVTAISTVPNTANITILSPFKNTIATDNWQEGEWSTKRGFPSAVAFHDGRLIFQKEDKFRASESDNFEAFNLETEGDSGSIQRDVATSGSVHRANWLMSLSRLVIGTDGAEVPARSDAFDTPLTPTNCAFKNASTVGSGPNTPERLDKQGFFISRSGVKVYKLVYNFEQQDYDSEDATELHEDLGEDHGGFTEIAAQRHPQPWLWMPMGDGQVALLLHSVKHQLSGWVRIVTDGEIESLYVLPAETEDRVYMWVKRTVNGSTVRYHEKLCLQSETRGAATTKLADAGVFTSASSTAITAAHLAGETGLVAWGTSTGGVSGFIGTLASSGTLGSLSCSTAGTIDLGASYTNTFVGLPYVGRYKTAKLAYGAEGGTAVMQDKIISQVGLLLTNTHKDAIRQGPDFDHLAPFQILSEGGSVTLASSLAVVGSYDNKMQPAAGGWKPDSRVCLQVNAGHPATINGLAMVVKTNER